MVHLPAQAAPSDLDRVREVVAAHHVLVYRVAYRILGNQADAEDATQDVFLRYVEHRALALEVQSLRAWLARIAINTSRNLIRSAHNRRRRERVWAEERESSEQSALRPGVHNGPAGEEAMESRRAVAEAVEALPDDLRLPLVLHYHEGFKYREIAIALDCPEGTIAKRIHTAKERLRATLKSRGSFAAVPFVDGVLARGSDIPIPDGLHTRILERVLDGAGVAATSAGGASTARIARGSGASRARSALTRRALVWSSLALLVGVGFVGLSHWPSQDRSAREGAAGERAAIGTGAIARSENAPQTETTATGMAVEDAMGTPAEAAVPPFEAPAAGSGIPWVTGQVTDEAGAAIAGARIRFVSQMGEIAATFTDDGGRYAFWGRDVAFSKTEGAMERPGAASPSDGEEEISVVDVGVDPGALDVADDLPEGAFKFDSPVLLEATDETMEEELRASAASPAVGAPPTPLAPSLSGFLEASARGYLTKRGGSLTIKAGATETAGFRLALACEIRGVVVGEAGIPIAGAEVMITVHNGEFPIKRGDAHG